MLGHAFQGAAAFDQPLGAWKVDQVTDMNSMFWGAAAFDQPLGAWKVEQVTEMLWMFARAHSLTSKPTWYKG